MNYTVVYRQPFTLDVEWHPGTRRELWRRRADGTWGHMEYFQCTTPEQERLLNEAYEKESSK